MEVCARVPANHVNAGGEVAKSSATCVPFAFSARARARTYAHGLTYRVRLVAGVRGTNEPEVLIRSQHAQVLPRI
jgi:hypothetical protein